MPDIKSDVSALGADVKAKAVSVFHAYVVPALVGVAIGAALILVFKH